MAPAVYHNLRLRLLLVAGRLDAALEQLGLMLKDGENVRDPRLASMVVRVFSGPGARTDVPTVMRMLRALRAVGTSVDVVHYTMALNHVAKRRAVAEAKEVVAMMEQDGVKANDVTYTILIHLLGMDGDLEGARAMLFGMQAKGVPVSTIAMSALLNTHLKGRRAADVPALFERMVAAGMPRDARVYHIVIKALMDLGRMDQARALLERMEAEGLKNDVRTYTQKAQLYFRDRDWREAFGLLEVRACVRLCVCVWCLPCLCHPCGLTTAACWAAALPCAESELWCGVLLLLAARGGGGRAAGRPVLHGADRRAVRAGAPEQGLGGLPRHEGPWRGAFLLHLLSPAQRLRRLGEWGPCPALHLHKPPPLQLLGRGERAACPGRGPSLCVVHRRRTPPYTPQGTEAVEPEKLHEYIKAFEQALKVRESRVDNVLHGSYGASLECPA
jgi:pentatricopeptide repeat protein